MKISIIISLSGDLASGKGVVSEILMEKLTYGIYRNGEYFRNLAKNMNMSLQEFGEYVELHPEIDIEIELANNQNSLVIENLTTGQKLELKNLPNDCKHIRVYNEGLKHVANVSNPSQNLRPYFNKEFIHLAYGTNNIKITGVGKVRFISQAKLTLI